MFLPAFSVLGRTLRLRASGFEQSAAWAVQESLPVMRSIHSISLLAAAACLAWPAGATNPTGVMTPKQAKLQGLTATQKLHERTVDKLIVRMRESSFFEAEPAIMNSRIRTLSVSAGVQMKAMRPLEGGAHLLKLDRPMTVSEARAMAARLVREANVEYAEPNVLFKRLAMPNEKRYAEWQWNLFAPTTNYTSGGVTTPATGGSNLPAAWDMTTGSNAVTVAVIDTGMTNHTDLNGVGSGATYVPGGRFLPGYDFISGDISVGAGSPPNFVANDGNGRDADASDPGDWVTVADKTNYADCRDDGEIAPYSAVDSTWHGTHMAGIAAATADNAFGIAGIGWNVQILPIRALGRCGGSLDDIADAIRWAAGLPVSGVPINPNPAQVISLSLGGDNSCGTYMQNAVDAAIAAGSVIVAATGNAGVEGLISPAACNGVLAVTAHTIVGENADYANIAAKGTSPDMVSAPGGGTPIVNAGKPTDDTNFAGYYIHSTVLFGATTPDSIGSSGLPGPAFAGYVGTSPATPHAAGVAALVKSMFPTATPAQVISYLLNTARAYSAGSPCAAGGFFAGQCGTGLLDAERALVAIGPNAIPTAAAGIDQVVSPNTTVTLSGAASKAYGGKTIASYLWTQTGGTPTVTLATPNAATTTFTAPTTGSLSFELRVTDNQSKVGIDVVTVRINNTPALAAAPTAPVVPAGSLVSFTVTGTDADGDTLTFVATAPSTVPVTALAPGGQFVWNTTGVPPGTYQLTYFASDGFSQSATQTVVIALTPVNLSTGGGGGALPSWQLLLLGALLLARAIRPREG
jgi:serine protease